MKVHGRLEDRIQGGTRLRLTEFLKAGGPVPAGAKTAGRLHTPGSKLTAGI